VRRHVFTMQNPLDQPNIFIFDEYAAIKFRTLKAVLGEIFALFKEIQR
jgi:hypothetical protein